MKWTHNSTSYEKMTLKEIEFLAELTTDIGTLTSNSPFEEVTAKVEATIKYIEASPTKHSRRKHFEAKAYVDHNDKTIEVRRNVKDRPYHLLTTIKQV